MPPAVGGVRTALVSSGGSLISEVLEVAYTTIINRVRFTTLQTTVMSLFRVFMVMVLHFQEHSDISLL